MLIPPTDAEERLAALLRGAFDSKTLLGDPAPGLSPPDAASAFRVQERLLALRGKRIGGWKVGARTATGPVQGAPLPADGIHASLAGLPRGAFPGARVGLELEIAFRFGRAFEPSARPYADAEVLAGVSGVCAAIEIVASRFATWPDVNKLAQLADLQNHGALVIGATVAYDADFEYATPSLHWHYGGVQIAAGAAANPAGDPRCLLPWVVNHCAQRHLRVEAGTIVTTGSLTGLYVPAGPGAARGEVIGLPPVVLTLS